MNTTLVVAPACVITFLSYTRYTYDPADTGEEEGRKSASRRMSRTLRGGIEHTSI